ncbi:hypothetical protein NYE67_10900 [Solibacillus sp. FSL W8-0474]|uniref:hypothetical protein n=1 Tax=Solibacillus sp. FSL W8-0474 TaxID=2975336 RepID=UPI0030F5E6D4
MKEANTAKSIESITKNLKLNFEKTNTMFNRIIVEAQSAFNSYTMVDFYINKDNELTVAVSGIKFVDENEERIMYEAGAVFTIKANPYSEQYILDTELYIEDNGVRLPKHYRKRADTIVTRMKGIVEEWNYLYDQRIEYYEECDKERKESYEREKQRIIKQYLAEQNKTEEF